MLIVNKSCFGIGVDGCHYFVNCKLQNSAHAMRTYCHSGKGECDTECDIRILQYNYITLLSCKKGNASWESKP